MASQKLVNVDAVCKEVSKRYRHVNPIDGIKWATEKVHVMAVIKSSRQLKLATQDSVQDAVLQAASMGLSLNPAQHHCYLIPRRMRRQKQGESDSDYAMVPTFAYASPSYRGLAHIAVHSGAVRFMRAEIHFKDDVFDYYGPHKDPKYIGNSIKTSNRKEGNAVGVFAVAKTKDGDYLCEYIDRETILKIRKMSEMPNGAIWHKDKMWTEGWKKAAIRRLYKTMPDSSPILNQAVQLMNDNEGMIQPSSNDIPAESVQVLSDNESLTLHAKLTDHSIEGNDINRWLNKLAIRFGVGSYTDIPADQFKEACNILDDALTKIPTK